MDERLLGAPGVGAKLVKLEGWLSKFNGKIVFPKKVESSLGTRFRITISKDDQKNTDQLNVIESHVMQVELLLPAKHFQVLGKLADVTPGDAGLQLPVGYAKHHGAQATLRHKFVLMMKRIRETIISNADGKAGVVLSLSYIYMYIYQVHQIDSYHLQAEIFGRFDTDGSGALDMLEFTIG